MVGNATGIIVAEINHCVKILGDSETFVTFFFYVYAR